MKHATLATWISKFVDNDNVSAALISGFSDIGTVDASADRLLIWDSNLNSLRRVAPEDIGGGGATTLAGLDDTAISTPVTGQYIKYVGTFWANTTIVWDDVNKLNSELTDIADVTALGAANTVLMKHATLATWISKFVDNDNVSAALISGFSDIGTVDASADRLLIWDSNLNSLRRVAPEDIGGGGSQTPILQPIDYDGFNQFDLGNIQFRDIGGNNPGNTIAHIRYDAPNLYLNVPSTNGFIFQSNGVSILGLANNIVNIWGETNMQSHKITNLTNPTNAQDAATKAYVDAGGSISGYRFYDESNTYWHAINLNAGSIVADGNFTENVIYFALYVPTKTILVSELGSMVSTSGTGSARIDLGIYTMNTSNLEPGTKMTSNSFANTSKGFHDVQIADTLLIAGTPYFFAFKWTDFSTVDFHKFLGYQMTQLPMRQNDLDIGSDVSMDYGWFVTYTSPGLPENIAPLNPTRRGENLDFPNMWFKVTT